MLMTRSLTAEIAEDGRVDRSLSGGHRHAQSEGEVMFGIGVPELLVILGIVVLIFGARRLPEIGSGLGKAIKNFKTGVTGKDEIDVTPEKKEVTEESRS
jgi:sec-independent protein translocase protein TatA